MSTSPAITINMHASFSVIIIYPTFTGWTAPLTCSVTVVRTCAIVYAGIGVVVLGIGVVVSVGSGVGVDVGRIVVATGTTGWEVGTGERKVLGVVGCEHPIIRMKKIRERRRGIKIFIMLT